MYTSISFNFWERLKKPIFILAPMEDVTDTVFRQIVVQTGKPDVFFTEFTNVDGMFSKGELQVAQRLMFDPIEKPIVAQIWGMKPENFYKAAKRLVEMGFDGIDINMGCPQRSVVCKGACSALINNHSLAKEIIDATKQGAGDLPVSVKTRLGYENIQTEKWIGFLLEQDLGALTVHGRTVAEMSAVPAHWDEIGKAVKMRDDLKRQTLVIGNGDVKNLTQAREKIEQYRVDGVMIGRGIFHNPWLFDETANLEERTIAERLELLKRHIDLFAQTWNGNKPFQVLKKYFKIYISGFDGAGELRGKLMEAKNGEEAKKILQNV